MELPKPVALDRPEAVIRDLDDAHLEHALRLWENGSVGTPVAFSLADVLGDRARGSRRSWRSSAARWPARSMRASTASARGCCAGRWRRNGDGRGWAASCSARSSDGCSRSASATSR